MPSASAARVCPGRTDSIPARMISAAYAARCTVSPISAAPNGGIVKPVTIKDTAIASVIAVPDLMRQSETLAGQSFQPIEVYSFAMLVYFVLLFPVTRGVDRIYRRVAHLGRS